ncbi:MAG: hypothetical protein ABW022_03230 [Actinoplanes sp.]
MKHLAIIDVAGDGSGYNWFCPETVKRNCNGEGYGFASPEAASAAAKAAGHPVGGSPGRFDGISGLVWYADVTKTYGRDLKQGDWLDSLDHRGARQIYETPRPVGGGSIEVTLSFGDTELVRADVEYDVVNPDSQVQPDGSLL